MVILHETKVLEVAISLTAVLLHETIKISKAKITRLWRFTPSGVSTRSTLNPSHAILVNFYKGTGVLVGVGSKWTSD